MKKITKYMRHLVITGIILIAMISAVSATTQLNQTYNGTAYLFSPLEETLGINGAEITTTTQSFEAGDHVKTTANLKVHTEPGTSTPAPTTEPAGSSGVIVGDFSGGFKADGYSWYVVRYQDGTRGWSAGEYLEKTGSEAVSRQLSVTQISQIYDTPEDFAGQYACGATCAVMTVAYYNAIDPWPFQSPYPSTHSSNYGNYISKQYTTPTGEILGDESDEQTYDAAGNVAKGAYGFIHYSSGSASSTRMVDYLKFHGIDAETDFSPTEVEVRDLIDNGFPVPASTKLTTAGHWVLITGYTTGGYYIVNDPNGCKPYTGDPCWGLNFNNYGSGALYTWNELQTADKYIFRIKSYSPPKPEVEVQAPCAGDILEVGAAQSIKWSANSGQGIDHIKIEFTANGGYDWITISDNEANDGQYSWAVPNNPSTNCWIRVTAYDINEQSSLDITDGSFTIQNPIIVKVKTPVGGAVLEVGAGQYIQWTATGGQGIDHIKLEFTSNGGTDWTIISDNEANDGLYTWTVPDTPSTNCLVRVTAFDTGGQSKSAVTYDKFTIQKPIEVKVKTPIGGAVLEVGAGQYIQWTATGGQGIDHIKLEFTSNGGTDWTIISDNEANDGLYTWTVPDTPSTNCLVRVTAFDTGGQSKSAVTYDKFTIQKPTDTEKPIVHVDSPNSGEVWTIGENQQITWTASDNVGITSIDLSYSINGGTSWLEIASGEENDGCYSWAIPNASSISCLVNVTASDAAGNQGFDVSDSTFEIKEVENPSIEPPVALFEINTSSGSAPLTVQFTDSSTGTISNWSWTFGDGGTATEQNPIHTYTATGKYTVSLTVMNTGGSNTSTQSNCINVNPLTLAPLITWQRCLGGSLSDGAENLQQTADGGLVIAGYTLSTDGNVSGNHGTADFWVVKLDGFGNLAWQRCLGGSSYDYARSIQQTSDGGYVVAGYTLSTDDDVSGNHGNYDVWVVKLDASGNPSWQKCLGGSSGDIAESIRQTTDGGYIVAGCTESIDGNVSGNRGAADVWVVKLDGFGNLIWQKCLGGSLDDFATNIQQTFDGGYIVVGYTYSTDGDTSGGNGSQDIWVVKLDAFGNLVWQKCLGGSSSETGRSILQTSDGGYIVAGFTTSTDGDVSGNHGAFDVWVVKLDATGNQLWQKCLGGSLNDDARCIQQTSNGGYIVVGHTQSTDGDVNGNHGDYDVWVVKLDGTGTVTWQRCLGGSSGDVGSGVYQTSDDGYIVAGYTQSTDGDVSGNHGAYDVRVVKLGGSGSVAAPVASFTTNVTSGPALLVVQFNDTSINSPISWSWTFGDGGSSTEQNPVHTYTAAGTYTVTLTTSNAAGSNTTSRANWISVQPPSSGGATLLIQNATVPVGHSIVIPVQITNVKGCSAFAVDFIADPASVRIDSVNVNSSVIYGSTITTNIVSDGLVRVALTNTDGITVTDPTEVIDVSITAIGTSGNVTTLAGTDAIWSDQVFATHPLDVIAGTIQIGLKGDLNNNGVVDIGDVAWVSYMVVGKAPTDSAADFNGNGAVDIGDAAKIAYYYVGKISAL